jgi:hypothetical protein
MLMKRSDMAVQAVLFAKAFFLHVLLAQVLVQTGQVRYSTAHFKIYLYHTGDARSVSVSGIYVIFLQFVAHWNSNL